MRPLPKCHRRKSRALEFESSVVSNSVLFPLSQPIERSGMRNTASIDGELHGNDTLKKMRWSASLHAGASEASLTHVLHSVHFSYLDVFSSSSR